MSTSRSKIGVFVLLACAVLILVVILTDRIGALKTNSPDQVLAHARGENERKTEFADNKSSSIQSTVLEAQADNYSFYDELRSNPYKRSAYQDICGEGKDQIAASMQRTGNLNDLTLKQQLVADELMARCNVWLGGVKNGDWELNEWVSSNSAEADLEDLMILQDSSRENTSIAKELLTSENPDLVIKSVAILLTRDEEFQRLVSNATGSKLPQYSRNAMADILPILGCRLEGDCGPNGVTMMLFCVSNQDACDNNILDYLRTIHSSNYVEDVSLMASAIYEARVSALNY